MAKHILILDDDKAILEVTKLVLEEAGYQVSTMDNGELLTEFLASTEIDLILIDLSINRAGERNIIKDLKNTIKTEKIPIIIMSANPQIEKISKQLHVDRYIRKPFDIQQLEEVVNEYLQT